MMIRIPADFKAFLKLLHSHNVKYLLVGGYAVGYHGYPRPTGDMDIWIAVSPENASCVIEALAAFGFSADSIAADMFTEHGRIIRMGLPPFRLEIITSISGVDFEECYSRRMTEILDGTPIQIIGLDDLKINKKASGRQKDLADLENLP